MFRGWHIVDCISGPIEQGQPTALGYTDVQRIPPEDNAVGLPEGDGSKTS